MDNSYLIEFMFDEPVKYKELKFYPIMMRDYFYFFYYCEVLSVDKNSIPDVKIISMSYLDYLILYSNEENDYIQKLLRVINLCTKEEIVEVYNTDKKNNFQLKIGNNFYSSSDVDEITKIICEQNMVELPDYSIQKEIRDKIEEGKRLRNRQSGTTYASLEDQMVSLSSATGISLEEIYKLSYRKFKKYLERTDMMIHYKIYLQATMSGMVSFKDTSFIKHWLSEMKEDNSNLVEVDSIKNKLDFSDKK